MRKSATPSSTVSTAPSSAAPEASPADGSAAMAAASASSLATFDTSRGGGEIRALKYEKKEEGENNGGSLR